MVRFRGDDGLCEEGLVHVVVQWLFELTAVVEPDEDWEPFHLFAWDGESTASGGEEGHEWSDGPCPLGSGTPVDTVDLEGTVVEEDSESKFSWSLGSTKLLHGEDDLGLGINRGSGIVDLVVCGGGGGGLGLELEVGHDTVGGSSTTESPEEIGVLGFGCGDDGAVGENDLHFNDVVQGGSPHTGSHTVPSVKSVPTDTDTV